ncbi:T9SS type A sorting domain-containing protein [Pontibacter sp. G13]|uniref:T9SS type A sorting domain-containing protein n=1 Tax=Pontibacter sp. G13 TaxID=3074898 RepID=UPI00288A7866|nr:T9SS type A sorting domain-containing protein [Pontibacter sp. G13]WNJ20574.1 T9SS type A sorting domain-containing protein [Pontibacter sp. G13]
MKKVYDLLTAFFVCACLMSFSSVSGQNLLSNPGFETGALAPWFGDNGSIVTIVEDTIEGSYAAVGNAAQEVALTQGVNYELRCKARIIAAESDQRVWVGVRGPSGLVQNTELFETTWEDMAIDFTAPETGTFKVWIWGQGSSSYTSDAWTLVVEGTSPTTSIDLEARKYIKILNHVDAISVDMPQLTGAAKIIVRDITGKEVFTTESNQNLVRIDAAQLPAAGMYIVSVQAGKYYLAEKVMVAQN